MLVNRSFITVIDAIAAINLVVYWYTNAYMILSQLSNMGETTVLALNSPNKASLRTTVPMFIVKQWDLEAGDMLDWSLDARGNNEVVIVIRKSAAEKK